MTLLDLLADACDVAAFCQPKGYVGAPDARWTRAEREQWQTFFDLAVNAWKGAATERKARASYRWTALGKEVVGLASSSSL